MQCTPGSIESTLAVRTPFNFFFSVFLNGPQFQTSRISDLRAAHGPNNTEKVGVDFSITHNVTCFVCVRDL